MTNEDDKYSNHVDHPRYGRGPIYTGLNPDPMSPDVWLPYSSMNIREVAQRYQLITGTEWVFGNSFVDTRVNKRIPDTAIIADLSRQSAATVPVTHYFDLDRVCRDCGRSFIFFAEEQKHWYEVLCFGLDSDCVRCVLCRKCRQVRSRNLKRYEELIHIPERSLDENLEFADRCLTLIEESVFTPKRLQFVRTVLNRIPSNSDDSVTSRHNELATRVRSIEAQAGK